MPKSTIECPVCQQSHELNIPTQLNVMQQPELKQDLLEGKIFHFECTHCGAVRQLNVQFLYIDIEQQYCVILLPEHQQTVDIAVSMFEQVLAQYPAINEHRYRLRFVYSVAELIEKVQIFDTGLQDTEVELVKVLTDGIYATEYPDTQIQGRYFYKDQSGPHILYISDGKQILAEFHEKLLQFIRKKYQKIISDPILGEFVMINSRWAMHVLENKESDTQTDHQN